MSSKRRLVPPSPSRSRLTTVYHVGNLDAARISHSFSQEGAELSVSRHPDEWRDVARLDGVVYRLQKRNAKFLHVQGHRHARSTSWAVSKKFLIPAIRWRVYRHDNDDYPDEESYIEFDTENEARNEAAEDDIDFFKTRVVKENGYRFGPRGQDYWRKSFPDNDTVDHTWAEAFAPIFYARAHYYDGVWFHERYDPDNLSLPRGLILQEKLPEWTIAKREPRG